MELEFVNVTYKENVRTPLEKTYINNFSYKFSEGKVYSIIGSTTSGKEKLPLLINAVNKPYTGIIKIGEFINDGKYVFSSRIYPNEVLRFMVDATSRDKDGKLEMYSLSL